MSLWFSIYFHSTSAVVALASPSRWQIHSIDPVLKVSGVVLGLSAGFGLYPPANISLSLCLSLFIYLLFYLASFVFLSPSACLFVSLSLCPYISLSFFFSHCHVPQSSFPLSLWQQPSHSSPHLYSSPHGTFMLLVFPRKKADRYSNLPDRLQLHPTLLQDLPDELVSGDTAAMRVVLCVHSHAPLPEFYAKLRAPKVCISLPCCADYGLLPRVRG